MGLQKIPFLKACAGIGYNDNLKLLWKAFDKDDSGSITIDELDLKSAEILADFRHFIKEKFGNSHDAFLAIDADGTRRVLINEFAASLKFYGFTRPARSLFHGLNRHGRKTIVEEDLKFLDDWKPLPYLTVSVNHKAAAEFKQLLFNSYRTYLKGWRKCLDISMTNHVNWQEFEAGCKKLGFRGDVAGAWRALDVQLKGYITLQEIDPSISTSLYDFRVWAELEFGSIRSAFMCFDDDNSKEITQKEFCPMLWHL